MIPAGTYRGQDKPVEIIVAPRTMVVTTKIPDSLVYEMLAALYEHMDQWYQFHPICKQVTWEAALSHLPVGPYHAGAIKYYKAKGLWKPEHDELQAKKLSELGLTK